MGSQRAKRRREKYRRSRTGDGRAAAYRRAEAKAAQGAASGCELWRSCPRWKRNACMPPVEDCLLRQCVLEAEEKVKIGSRNNGGNDEWPEDE